MGVGVGIILKPSIFETIRRLTGQIVDEKLIRFSAK
jgi:hypothetical protein